MKRKESKGEHGHALSELTHSNSRLSLESPLHFSQSQPIPPMTSNLTMHDSFFDFINLSKEEVKTVLAILFFHVERMVGKQIEREHTKPNLLRLIYKLVKGACLKIQMFLQLSLSMASISGFIES